MRRMTIVLVALGCLLAPVVLHANIYLKVDGPGQYTVTNSPGDESYVKVIDRSVEDDESIHTDEIEEAVQRAEGQYRIPQSLIYAIIQNYSNNQQGLLMPLPPGYIDEHGDTITRQSTRNILESTKWFQRMLRRYDGNMTLTLAAYYAGPKQVDDVGGVPSGPDVQRFVEDVRSTFDEIEQRSAVIYTYRDESGTLHVVNIR